MKGKRGALGYRAAMEDPSYKTDLEVAQAMGAFIVDPPDTEFQRGYLSGLRERLRQLLEKRL
jgi:hypothetical protein